MTDQTRDTAPGPLRAPGGFRLLWLSRVISFTGIGAGQAALVLLAARAGAGQVSGVLLAGTLPRLLGPLAGAVADRVDQRRLLAGCEAAQGAVFAVLAAARPSGAALLALVAAAGLLAAFFAPAGKSIVPRLVPAGQVARANALLGFAFNLQVVAGPALGGLLAGLAGPAAAFAANAAAFGVSALLLTGLRPLPPAGAPQGQPPGPRPGLLAETWQGLRHTAGVPLARALVAGTVVFVAFAAVDNVALVFLVERVMRQTGAVYGAVVAAYGAGMLGASLLLARWAGRLRPGAWLALGVLVGAAGAVCTGLAGSATFAALGQFTAGAGNTLDVAATDTLVSQAAAGQMRGRLFGVAGSAAQLGSAAAVGAGGWLVAGAGPRRALLIGGGGMLASLLIFGPVIRLGRQPSWRGARGQRDERARPPSGGGTGAA